MKTALCYDQVDDQEIENVLFTLESQFRLVRATLRPDWNSREAFDRVLTRLDRQSSPGWPLMREASTIGQWLYRGAPFPDPLQSGSLWLMVQDVFSGKYQHIFRVFIKQEPHTRAKAEEGRWRLIMMCSLPVQVAWHMVVDHLETSFLKTYKSPLFHSFNYIGGGWRQLRRFSKQHRLEWCADKSSWDWCSPGWVYVVCRELRKRLTQGATEEWVRVLDLLYDDAYFHSRVMLSDGSVHEQLTPGLMKSGLVVTISDNGIAQCALHVRAEHRLRTGPTFIIATGDDTFQQAPHFEEQYVAELRRGGCVVKEYGFGTDFMGFHVNDGGFFPKYVEKHIETVRYQKDEFLAESIEGYLRIYVYDELAFSFWRDLAIDLGFSMPSRQYFLYFAGNPDALEHYTFARPSFGDRMIGKGVVD